MLYCNVSFNVNNATHFIPYRWFHIIIHSIFAILVDIDSISCQLSFSSVCHSHVDKAEQYLLGGFSFIHPASLGEKFLISSYSGGFHRGHVFICLIRGVSGFKWTSAAAQNTWDSSTKDLLFDKYTFFSSFNNTWNFIPTTEFRTFSMHCWRHEKIFLKIFLDTWHVGGDKPAAHFLLRTSRSGCEWARVRTHLRASKSVQYS